MSTLPTGENKPNPPSPDLNAPQGGNTDWMRVITDFSRFAAERYADQIARWNADAPHISVADARNALRGLSAQLREQIALSISILEIIDQVTHRMK
ncbi:MAG: hypothetical protein ACT443_04245 [Gemmatimonadota bacterium]